MAESKQVRFHYIKSNEFRVIHVDGAHGGITPRGNIFAALYSVRAPIPQMTVHNLKTDGTLDDEVERKVRDGIVNEVEVGVMFDLASAEAFHAWLEEKIAKLKEMQAKVKKDNP